MKPYPKKITDERKNEIRELLREQGLENKSIDYNEFLKLYAPYKNEMMEVQFAAILGISEKNFKTIKYEPRNEGKDIETIPKRNN